MRRLTVAAALATLLTCAVAAPAMAVPPNEVLIARNLQRMGVVAPWATGRMAARAARALGAKAPRHELKSPLVERTLSGGETALSSYLESGGGEKGAVEPYSTRALVLLVEFGDAAWPEGSPAPTGPMTPGPVHGHIPAPAADDNNTFWPGDFSAAHYQQELFGDSYPLYSATGALRGTSDVTMRSWFLEQSHGTFTVTGDIRDWVKLDMPESWYGADSVPWEVTDDLTGPVWRVARDAVLKFAEQNPDFPWADYDQENQYGITGDDFAQPDGYIDHLIIITAGSGESAGGGVQGSDALWPHSSGIMQEMSGGPGDMPGMMVPGTDGQGPQGKGIWVFPYTQDPEDGDPGVFCHEFSHDLGLPDEYDTAGDPQDSAAGFWTIMSQGSWLGREWGLGSAPGPLNAWDKAALGFIAPKVVKRGTSATVKLSPAATGGADDTGAIIQLPKRRHLVELSGKDGVREWYSDMGDDLDTTLTTSDSVQVPGAEPRLTFRTWYDMESGYDFGFVLVSSDGGETWTTAESAKTVEVADGVWALTGTDTIHWDRAISFDLSPWAGQKVLIRFRYLTDTAVTQRGWEVTDIALGGTPLPESAFTSDGWLRVDGQRTVYSDAYYIAEYRTYAGSGASLQDCYEFDRDRASWVDWYSYNEGLLLIYRDTFWKDNDVSLHPGEGGWMTLDARPNPDAVSFAETAGYWRPRIQLRDGAFSLGHTPAQTIYFRDYETGVNVGERTAPGKLAAPAFSDAWQYWFPETPGAGVKVPADLGVRVRVKSVAADGMTVFVDNAR